MKRIAVMDDMLGRIEAFIGAHHLLSLATSYQDEPKICSAFYIYDAKTVSFIIASSLETEHIQNVLKNLNVAVNIALETDVVGKIQGLQCQARMSEVKGVSFMSQYLKKYPYAAVMKPTLWQITITQMKFTDNRLGFGKKLIWKRETLE